VNKTLFYFDRSAATCRNTTANTSTINAGNSGIYSEDSGSMSKCANGGDKTFVVSINLRRSVKFGRSRDLNNLYRADYYMNHDDVDTFNVKYGAWMKHFSRQRK